MKSNSEATIIARSINTFLNEYAPSQKTNSQHTLKSYHDTLSLFIGFLEIKKRIIPEKLNAKCFDGQMLEEWLAWLKNERVCSPETCNNRLSSLRSFLQYLASRDVQYLYLYEESLRIVFRKTAKKKVEGMSRDSVAALLESPDPRNHTGRRDLTFMILLYSTACRLDELLSLKNKQIYLDTKKPYIIVIGKGKKIRTIYLLPKAVAHLNKYMEDFHGMTPDPEAYLFYSRNTGIYGKMSQPAIDKMLKKHAKRAHEKCSDVPIGLHAHQFRHAKASHWLEDGMNIVQISFLLGHEHLQTTMVYLDITTETEAKALATLEDENVKKVTPKWKNHDGSLVSFCGVKSIKR